jgi:hypothetical protein
MKAMWTKNTCTQKPKTNKQKTIISQRRTHANTRAKKITTNKKKKKKKKEKILLPPRWVLPIRGMRPH